ncbi:ankyrin [Nemania abortiva]|nr:ankyrin [Nemania abortiva]
MLLDRYYAYAENRREDLSAKDTDYGRTPLIYAVYKRYTKVIERLLHLGAKTETRDNRMKSALIVAARRGDVSIIELLVSYGVDINAGGRIYSGIYRTALYEAASRNQPDVVKCLLAANAKVNQEGGKYNTALCAACCTGDESTVSLLLEKGADITLSGGRFVNALSCAVYSKSASLVNRLINAGIEASEINAQDKQGRTAVHIAARYCDWEVIGMLRNKGADLAKVDKQHRTLLHYAVLGSDLSLVMSILNDEMLRSQIHARDVDQWTPLHWACRVIGNSSVVSALIDHGADVRGLTPYGWTPQNIAIFHDEPEIARVLEENAKENDCNTNVAPSDAPDREADPKAAIRRQWRVASHKSSSKCDSCFTEVSYAQLPYGEHFASHRDDG